MTDQEKSTRLYQLFMDHLESQADALGFIAHAVVTGGDELACLDEGKGLWRSLQNITDQINEIIEQAEILYKGEEVTA